MDDVNAWKLNTDNWPGPSRDSNFYVGEEISIGKTDRLAATLYRIIEPRMASEIGLLAILYRSENQPEVLWLPDEFWCVHRREASMTWLSDDRYLAVWPHAKTNLLCLIDISSRSYTCLRFPPDVYVTIAETDQRVIEASAGPKAEVLSQSRLAALRWLSWDRIDALRNTDWPSATS